MSRRGAKVDRAVVLRTTFYFVSGFVAEDAQQREVLGHHSGDSWEIWAAFKRMVLKAAD